MLNQQHASREPIDDALLSLRLVETRVCQSIFRAPWGLAVSEAVHTAVFVVVARGVCRLKVGEQQLSLEPGDFAFLPHGVRHELSDAAGTAPLSPGALSWDSRRGRCVIDAGGRGEPTHLVTGSLAFATSPVLAAMPAVLHTPREDLLGWQEGVAGVLAREALRPGLGSEVVLTHLAGLLAIGAIRRWLEREDASDPFLRALRSPALRKVLGELHADPRKSWTLDEPARLAGMSRSTFSQQFTETIGEAPMRYWTRWRLAVARDWLMDGRLNVDEVADALGYRSRAAFSRAFKASTGEPPGLTRRRGRRELLTLNDRVIGAVP